MTPLERKAALMLKGVSQTAIAESLDIDPSRVNEVIGGTRKNLTIRKAIVKALGKDPRKKADMLNVFPDERYRRPSGRVIVPLAEAA